MKRIDDVFNWVDAKLRIWMLLSMGDINSKSILESQKMEMGPCDEPIYIQECNEYIRVLERTLTSVSEYNCRYIFKRLLRMSHLYFNNLPKDVPFMYLEGYKSEGLRNVIYWDLHDFFAAVNNLSNELGIDIKQLCEWDLPSVNWTRQIEYQIDNDKKYKTLPRTHRIAAIKELIRKSGLCRNIDDTKISAFVEAVTGGNIEAQAKNTQSYKTPTKEAQNAAAEWLRKIGIE